MEDGTACFLVIQKLGELSHCISLLNFRLRGFDYRKRSSISLTEEEKQRISSLSPEEQQNLVNYIIEKLDEDDEAQT